MPKPRAETTGRAPRSLGAALLALAGALPVRAQEPAAAAPPSAHERMLALLDDIARKTDDDNPFLGSKRVRELRARWAAKKDKASALERWTLGRALGNAELEQGDEAAAIELLEMAVAAVDELSIDRLDRAKLPPEDAEVVDLANYYRNQTWFDLGLAYLRLGETQNCCLRHTGESCILPLEKGALHGLEEGSRGAIRCFMEVLAHRPAVPDPRETRECMRKAQWLLNLAYMTLGEYPAGVPREWLVDLEQLFRCEVDFPRFENVLPALGLDTLDLSGGVIVDDFDGDEYLDILLSCWDTRGPMHFFRNQRDGTFADRSAQANLGGLYGGLNMSQADYDNDGDADVFVPRGAWMGAYGKHPASLLQNDGHGVFHDVSLEAGFERARFPGKTAAWADYDLDGDLDLFLGFDYARGYEDALPQLYRNDGDGRFTECARAAGVADGLFVMGATWGDYDGDRYPDLYVAALPNDVNDGRSRLYHNQRDGTFRDVTAATRTAGTSAPFPCWFFDYDNDGALDLYVSCRAGTIAVLADPSLRHCTDALYKGDGRGGFVELAQSLGLTHPSLPMGANFGDLNGDGWLDLYLGTGFAPFFELHPNVMYLNQGGKGFANVTLKGGFGHLQKGHGVAFADLDTDGDQDVYIQMGGAFPGDAFSDALFENPGFGARWLALELEGTRTNRSAIGARIHLELEEPDASGKSVRRSLYRHVNGGGSFGSSPLRQQLGLGHASAIVALEILWPVTGATQVFHGVPLDRSFRVVEGKDELVPLVLAPTHLGGTPARR